MTNMRAVVEQYFDCLEKADLASLLELFHPQATVHSPLYGTMRATHFYPQLFKDTRQSQLQIHHIFTDEAALKAAAHFRYQWSLANGKQTAFEGVDVFELDEQANITQLTILYDTWPRNVKGDV